MSFTGETKGHLDLGIKHSLLDWYNPNLYARIEHEPYLPTITYSPLDVRLVGHSFAASLVLDIISPTDYHDGMTIVTDESEEAIDARDIEAASALYNSIDAAVYGGWATLNMIQRWIGEKDRRLPEGVRILRAIWEDNV